MARSFHKQLEEVVGPKRHAIAMAERLTLEQQLSDALIANAQHVTLSDGHVEVP